MLVKLSLAMMLLLHQIVIGNPCKIITKKNAMEGYWIYCIRNMIKVLMVVHEMNRGGIENFVMNLYRVIDKEKIQFDFVEHTERNCDFDNEINSLGGVIYHCPDYRIINHLAYSKWWKKFFNEHSEYRIVHSHLDSCANIHLRIAKKCGCVTIAHSHSSAEGTGIRAVAKKILKIGFNNCCDYKFACSKLAAEWLYGKDAVNSIIINNGIIVKDYCFNDKTREEIRKEWNICPSEVVIGNIGRIDQNKNQGFIIDIVNAMNKAGVSTTFVCAGAGTELANYQKKARKLGMDKKTIFLGLRNDVNRVLQGFDIFVMPSVYEGLPVSSIEAQACGLKCVLSDTVSKECNITNNVTFLSLNNSSMEWANAIIPMIGYERNEYNIEIQKAGYDIMSTAQYLTNFYIKINRMF